MSLALPEALFFTGIDWAAGTHAVCVMDAAGKIVAEFTIAHSAEGIAQLIRRLARYGDPGGMPVAIERPSGRLVDLLLEAGHPVVPVSPNAIKTWREGEVLSGAKSDAGDAAVIAEYLRLRSTGCPRRPYSDETKALRTVVRTRDDLVELRVAATNQLSALLEATGPEPGHLRRRRVADQPGLPDPLPDPGRGRAPGRKADGRVLRQARLQRPPDRRPAAGPAARRAGRHPGEALTEALRDAVLALVAVLTALNSAVRDLDRSVAAHLGEHPDGEIFTSLPRSGRVNAAQVLAEWGDCRQAYDGPDSVAALAGVQPGHQGVRQAPRRGFPLGLQQAIPRAITTFADNSRHASPWAAKIYNDARAAGKDHPHAVRILARAWIRLIWPCWVNRVPYDPARHRAAAALAEQSSSQFAA